MKKSLLLLLLLPLLSLGQERIRFQAPQSALREVSRVVSIDRVESASAPGMALVTAYADASELAALKTLGYSYSLHPEPQPKVINMATTVAQLRQWDRYPTYDTYVSYMQQMAADYPALCRLDTIGTSVQNRLILCLRIHGTGQNAPQFFYSSTMHGDEVTGFYFMLRLIDTLLTGYGQDPDLTQLVDNVDIYINPNANPDGTYYGSNANLTGARRYNANSVDLNRNYPDPFGVTAANSLQRENVAMMDYVGRHHFLLSANLHGGAEVMNYPWDSFTSAQRRHPEWQWWTQVCRRYVDTCRLVSANYFDDVTSSGYIAGGDWYVISNGRQDYMNHFHNCLELTMEISSTKKLSSDRLAFYWGLQHRSLINYIKEILPLAPEPPQPPSPDTVIVTDTIIVCDTIHDTLILCDTTYIHDTIYLSIPSQPKAELRVYPNPTRGLLYVETEQAPSLQVLDLRGRVVMTAPLTSHLSPLNLQPLPAGIYLLRVGNEVRRIVKQ